VQQAGIDEFERTGNPFPPETLASVRRTKVGIKGPTTTPVGSGFRSVNVQLRKELDLYACLRPCKAYEGFAPAIRGLDLVIMRENTEDLYAGIEYEQGTAEAARMIEVIAELGSKVRPDSGISIKPISIFGSDRIVEAAFDYAKHNGRHKVTAVHKANIMKFTTDCSLTWRARWQRATPRSSSRIASSTTCVTSSCHAPRNTTCWCCEPLRRHRLGPRRRHDRRSRLCRRREHRR